jgi:hypothetical protein
MSGVNKRQLTADKVDSYSEEIRQHYRAEAEARRQDRIAFGKAHEEKQKEYAHPKDDGKNKAMQALGKLGGRPRKSRSYGG